MSVKTLTATEVVEKWIEAFNNRDVMRLTNLYAIDAINHQMPNAAVHGSIAIGKMFAAEFEENLQMVCIPVQIIAQHEWAVLEWTDPNGFCGCGFFQVINNVIQTQRGYWDKLSFMKLKSD